MKRKHLVVPIIVMLAAISENGAVVVMGGVGIGVGVYRRRKAA